MLHIALCDDEPIQRTDTTDLLRRYCGERPALGARVTVCSSGSELLALVEGGERFDLFVLDVIMPGLSGIELGLRLREQGEDGPIIYLTASPDYALDSYRARAFYYLLKPPAPAQLYAVLDEAVEQLGSRRRAVTPVKTRAGVRLLALRDIVYIELSGRAARYHLNGGESVDSVTLHGSFAQQVEPLLSDRRFVLCGSSFAVNLHYVTAVDKRTMTVRTGQQIPLPRGQAAALKQRWGDYWLNGGSER